MKRIISKTIYFIMLLSFLSGGNMGNRYYASSMELMKAHGAGGTQKIYPLAKLQEDFNELKDSIEYNSPKLFANKKELSDLYKSQYKLLKNNMNELQFYRVVSPIVAKLNCGHSSISLTEEYSKYIYKSGDYLPLNLKIINNKGYLYQNLSSAKIPLGAEILSINKKSMKDIITTLLRNIPADGSNTSRKYHIINNWFREQYFNFIDNPKAFEITYKDPSNSSTKKATAAAASMESQDKTAKKLYPAKAADNSPYMGEFQENYTVLTIKSFAFYDSPEHTKFTTFIDDFFKKLKKKNIANLIIDLRDNWGGDPYCASYLFSYLIDAGYPYLEKGTPYYNDLTQPIKPAKNNFTKRLFTLINGASFSSTGHLCALLRYHKIGTFIGEESGGSFVCTSGSGDRALGNTNLKFHISTTKYAAAVTGLTPGRGVIPDNEVIPGIQDYLANRDVVMDNAVGLIGK